MELAHESGVFGKIRKPLVSSMGWGHRRKVATVEAGGARCQRQQWGRKGIWQGGLLQEKERLPSKTPWWPARTSVSTWHGAVDRRQTDCQIFLQYTRVYSGSAENCNSRTATMMSLMQAPQIARQGECFYSRDEEAGRAVGNRETIEFSLAEFLPGMKSLSVPCWALLLLQGHPTLFNWGFIFINLYRA